MRGFALPLLPDIAEQVTRFVALVEKAGADLERLVGHLVAIEERLERIELLLVDDHGAGDEHWLPRSGAAELMGLHDAK